MNAINSIIMLSCQKFHDISSSDIVRLSSVNSIRNIVNENVDLDEITRDNLLKISGKSSKIDFEDGLQKRYYQGTTKRGVHEVPSKELYKSGTNKGKPKTIKIVPVGKITATSFDIPTFQDKGDLVLIYSFEASAKGNVKENPNQRTFICYEKLAQAISNILKSTKDPSKLTQKKFESAFEQALDKVDITVNCECRDFVQRFSKPAHNHKYYLNLSNYGVDTKNVGSDDSDKIAGTGKQKNPEKPYTSGVCKHIIKAIANKRETISRVKSGNDNIIGMLYDSVLNSEKDSLLYNLFIKGTNKDRKGIKDSYSFDSVMELAKEWINSNEISLISGIQAERIMEDMTMKYSDELEDYSIHAGKYNGIKVCIVETPTSVYSIYDRDDEIF